MVFDLGAHFVPGSPRYEVAGSIPGAAQLVPSCAGQPLGCPLHASFGRLFCSRLVAICRGTLAFDAREDELPERPSFEVPGQLRQGEQTSST